MAKPDRGNRAGLVWGLALGATSLLACSDLNTPLYFQGTAFEAQGNEMMLPTQGLSLRFRAPTDKEQMALDAERAAKGYDMDIPWVSRDKVTNLSDQTSAFTLMVDGASQYWKYDTQVVSAALQQGANDPPQFLPLIPLVPQMLAPGASYSGVVREDDFAEGELDLDALGRWNDPGMTMPNFGPTFAGVLINRSEVPPYIGMGKVPGYVPECPSQNPACDPTQEVLVRKDPNLLVVPAMIEVDLRLKTDVHMGVEWFVRVRDDDDRLWHNDADPVFDYTPTLFQPTVM